MNNGPDVVARPGRTLDRISVSGLLELSAFNQNALSSAITAT